MRTDCTRDNRKIPLPNASLVASGLGAAKRGNWVSYRQEGAAGNVGRVVGRVVADGRVYVEIIALLGAADCPAVRWVDPAEISLCQPVPPRRIFEFICGDWSSPADILARVERGFLSDSYLSKESGHA